MKKSTFINLQLQYLSGAFLIIVLTLASFQTSAQTYWIPNIVDAGPVIESSFQPANYYFANQSCIEAIIEDDPWCIEVSFDETCQAAYCACASTPGCTDPTACNYNSWADCNDGTCDYGLYYIPNIVESGVVVQSCYPLVGYYLADQTCIQAIIENDSWCTEISFDEACQAAYCACTATNGCTDEAACNYNPSACLENGSCEYALYYIPDVGIYGPVVLSCTDVVDYTLAQQECIEAVIAGDSFCIENSFDGICRSTYNECLGLGCTYGDALNYDSTATIDDGSCVYPAYCEGDANSDGIVNIVDLLAVSSFFGYSCD